MAADTSQSPSPFVVTEMSTITELNIGENNHTDGTEEKDYKDYRLKIAVSVIFTLLSAILFIAAGVAGLNANRSDYLFYVQIATSLLALLLSVSETFLAINVVGAFVEEDKKEADETAKRNRVSRLLTQTNQHPQTELFNFTEAPRSIVIFFFGTLCLNASIVSLFWALSSIISYPTFDKRSYYHYRFVDIIIGYLFPILLLAGLALILITLQIISIYAFQPEGIFSSIIVFVDYKRYNEDKTKERKRWKDENTGEIHTSDFGAWSISEYFYYPIVEVNDDVEEIEKMYDKKSDYSMIAKFMDKIKLPSMCFALILVLNIILCLRVITDAIVIKEVHGRHLSCEKVIQDDKELDCFAHSTHKYINCNDDNSTHNMECYRYYSPSEIDPLGALIRAIFLFITFEKFLQLLFGVAKTLYQIRYHKAWGLSIFVIGVIMIIFSILCGVFYDHLETGFVFLSVFQFGILSSNIILAGFLLIINQGYYIKDGHLVIGTGKSSTTEDSQRNEQPLSNETTT